MKILVINGPNINFLGIREKQVYGSNNYKDVCRYIEEQGKNLGLEVHIVQSNVEGEIVNFIQEAYGKYDGIVINPAAYTHYSIAIMDAIKAVNIKTVEVHISNIYSREEFRKKSVIAPACIGQISGFGIYGYVMALMALKNLEVNMK
ncbi:type II 3-dehydroquinate dehydratase [Haloimpatiens massiliensis]|uniref:type II 3-dehydroquinate dehydratase n=1 Tax=Haloimpatiens massiliensis TaxID=1658110 RepID=UPI000C849DB7|nr:type II 3-dehydroquinate dehydratase [Haloimpatiens massiliensis]